MPVKIKLATLLGEKQARENRVINVITLAQESDVPKQTIYNWLSGKTTRFDQEIIGKFCKYFNCKIEDLLEYEPGDEEVEPG